MFYIIIDKLLVFEDKSETKSSRKIGRTDNLEVWV
jgi:hypothetical protein